MIISQIFKKKTCHCWHVNDWQSNVEDTWQPLTFQCHTPIQEKSIAPFCLLIIVWVASLTFQNKRLRDTVHSKSNIFGSELTLPFATLFGIRSISKLENGKDAKTLSVWLSGMLGIIKQIEDASLRVIHIVNPRNKKSSATPRFDILFLGLTIWISRNLDSNIYVLYVQSEIPIRAKWTWSELFKGIIWILRMEG